jgi:protein-tyrosine phosphatase
LIDLHCHLLPGIDDGAGDLQASLEMARLSVADGVTVIACTPHIFPGVYDNSGPDIRRRIRHLQSQLDAQKIACRLVTGADVHVAPYLVAKLKSGEALSLNDSRYVLVEPPHHILPPNTDGLFFSLLSAGYFPILTHPERMTWAEREYDVLVWLVQSGVWMQITAGSVLGKFGPRAKKLSERMLREGMAHIVASDAHDPEQRAPLMGEALTALRGLVGDEEALNLVRIRPQAILDDTAPSNVPLVPNVAPSVSGVYGGRQVSLSNRVLRLFRAR